MRMSPFHPTAADFRRIQMDRRRHFRNIGEAPASTEHWCFSALASRGDFDAHEENELIEGIKRPYRRTLRPFISGHYPWGYAPFILHRGFAQDPAMYVRGFRLLQNDLERLFEYIEPSDENLECYSFRVHELLLRACVEVEANSKAILRENGYPENKKNQWTENEASAGVTCNTKSNRKNI